VCWCRQVPRRTAFRIGVRFMAPGVANQGRLSLIEAYLSDLTIRLVCPGCGAAFSIKKRFEGQVGRCPKCRSTVEVLDQENLPELTEEKRASEEKAKADSRRGPVKSSVAPNVPTGLVAFIDTVLHSRMHMEIVQHFVKRPQGQVAGVAELAMLLTAAEPRMHAALRELASRGVLKEVGARAFCYDPSPEVKRRMAELATLMASPARRSEVLALVLEAEKAGGGR
jgi:Zn-finger nucleic acid-binding protein